MLSLGLTVKCKNAVKFYYFSVCVYAHFEMLYLSGFEWPFKIVYDISGIHSINKLFTDRN